MDQADRRARAGAAKLQLFPPAPPLAAAANVPAVINAETAKNPFCGTAGENIVLRLECVQNGATITGVDFASFGVSNGECPGLTHGFCHATDSLTVVESLCRGKRSCELDAANDAFGGDPCPGKVKSLAVVARCSKAAAWRRWAAP